jgi:ABC-type Fe3+ transport system permease subunit
MKRIYYLLLAFLSLACLFNPIPAMAAGPAAEMLIVVADNRVVDWSFSKFWVDYYNTDPFMFGLWCTIFTAFLGVSLGFITDQIMRHTGLDLSKRTIVEH